MQRTLVVVVALAACETASNDTHDLTVAYDLAMAADLAGADLTGAPVPDLAGADLAGVVAPMSKLFGGSNFETGDVVIASPDGYLYVGGTTRSTTGDLAGIKDATGFQDVWILKLDGALNIVWSRTYGGADYNNVRALALAADGDLLVLSVVTGAGRQVTSAFGKQDVWLLKLNAANGDPRWNVTFGGAADEEATAVRETVLPGGTGWEYTVLGYTKSNISGNLVENVVGFTDALVGRYLVAGPNPTPTPSPNPLAVTFGGNSIETGVGFLGDSIVGITESNAGADVAGTTARGLDDVFIKPPAGQLVRFGGNQHDQIKQILPDGVFIGRTGSNSDEVTCSTRPAIGGVGELWIGKLTQAGLGQSLCFGSDGSDEGFGIAKLLNGGYVAVGKADVGGDITAPGDGPLVVILNSTLQITSHYRRGTAANSVLRAVAVMADGTVFAVGDSNDKTGEFIGNHGSGDVWVAKLVP